jgi:glutamyl-tRNA reductase
MFEKGRAMQRIARGDDIEKVMEDMSRRITDKIIHPVLKAITNSDNFKFDVEQSRNTYNEIMKNVAKAADHIDSDT